MGLQYTNVRASQNFDTGSCCLHRDFHRRHYRRSFFGTLFYLNHLTLQLLEIVHNVAASSFGWDIPVDDAADTFMGDFRQFAVISCSVGAFTTALMLYSARVCMHPWGRQFRLFVFLLLDLLFWCITLYINYYDVPKLVIYLAKNMPFDSPPADQLYSTKLEILEHMQPEIGMGFVVAAIVLIVPAFFIKSAALLDTPHSKGLFVSWLRPFYVSRSAMKDSILRSRSGTLPQPSKDRPQPYLLERRI